MRFTYYLKNCIWEWILCTVLSGSISVILFNGFYIAAQRQSNYPLILCVTGILTAGCILGAYNRRSVLIALGSGLAAALLGVILIQRMESVQNAFRDQESNPYLYFLILILTSLIVFFLSRTRTGTGVLFVAGAFLAAAMQFLYESVALYSVLLFLCGSGAMYIYKNYQKNVLETQTVKVAFGRTFSISIALCVLIIALSAGVFYGIVKPLDPPKHDLKLITKYMALEVLEKVGIADTHIINDSDDSTDNINDNEKDSNKKDDKEDNSEGDKEKQKDENQKDKKNNPSRLDDSQNPVFYAIKYLTSIITPLLLIPLILLLILLAILIKLWLRRRWMKKMREKPKREQVIYMYQFYLKKFRRMKIRKAPQETPFEFGARAEAYLRDFQAEDTSFHSLTDIFVRAKYGADEIEEGDYQSYLKFYKVFYKNCRKHLGTFKYILKFFVL